MMKKLVIAKIKANEGRKLFFKLRSPVSKCIEHGHFLACKDHFFSYIVIGVVITIRPALVLNETQIQS